MARAARLIPVRPRGLYVVEGLSRKREAARGEPVEAKLKVVEAEREVDGHEEVVGLLGVARAVRRAQQPTQARGRRGNAARQVQHEHQPGAREQVEDGDAAHAQPHRPGGLDTWQCC